MRRVLVATATAAVLATGAAVVPVVAAGTTTPDLTTLVNPLAGSLGPGFPTVAAGLPFGMTTPGPITTTPAGDDPVNYVGYAYQDPQIRGFALTHFSGAGVHLGGELPFMPTTGAVTSSNSSDWASPFSHADETAQPGYYATTLTRYGIDAELTATTRTASERFTFPATTQANILLDTSHDNDGTVPSTLQIQDDHTVTGSVRIPASGGVTIWFTARFDHAFTQSGTWSTGGGWVTFDTTHDQQVRADVGISYTDADGATRNLDTEDPAGTTFDAIKQRATGAWNDALHGIDVTGGTSSDQQTFYTCLYHALLMPTTFDDTDGRYRGFDDVIRTVAAGHHHYTDLSLWDTYRTQTPLLTLVAPDVAHDLGISLLDDTDQNGGVIPKWVRGNRDYSIMGGDSGTPTLATLVTDGALTGADAQRAYDALVRQANNPNAGPRDNLTDYLRLGYIPFDHSSRGAAVTLEYAIDDASVAALAGSYGTPEQQQEFSRRAGSWRNLLDPSSDFLRPRMSDGSWANPTQAGPVSTWNPAFQDGWQEGTGWQYLWLVPQDVHGLTTAIGVDTAKQRLDEFFAQPANQQAAPVVPLAQQQGSFFGVYYAGNQYTPANETDLQAPWLYNWLGEPWKTQQVVRAESQVFNATPYGLPGNDDAGTMSAAYVLSAIGLYQAQPGVDAWELAAPLFEHVQVRHGLTIDAPGSSATNQYVAAAALDGRSLDRTWLSDGKVSGHHTLTLTMSPAPTAWASGPDSAPPSLSDPHH